MSKEHRDPSEKKIDQARKAESSDTHLDKASDRHAVRNASGHDMQEVEEKRSSRWEGSFSGGKDGHRVPVLKPGMTRAEAEKADSELNSSRFVIDMGNDVFETSDGSVTKGAKGKFLPFGTPKHLELSEKEAELIDKKIADLKEAQYDHVKVKAGDNIWDIAKAHYGDANKWGFIFRANKTEFGKAQGVAIDDADPRKIQVGQTLRLPPKEATMPDYDPKKKHD